ADPERVLLVCEGPFDAIALDHFLRTNKTRARYDVLAVPGAAGFNKEWLKYLKSRTVRLLFDNDKAGRDGQQRIAKLVRDEKVDCRLSVLEWPSGYPDKCDIGDLIRDGVNVADFAREHCIKVTAGQRRILFLSGDAIPEEKVGWWWRGHIPFNTFVSLSGLMGTQKSAVVRDLAARGTAGLLMPNSTDAVPPFDVLYFTSEDSASRVRDLVRIHHGDVNRLHVHDIATSSEPLDILDCMADVEAGINSHGARVVIIDALNSFVGGEIGTDSKARRTLSGRLQSLARRTGACIIGIRNWGRAEGGTASQKALGATSLSDVARCVMNTRELPPIGEGGPRRFLLEFEKVSDAPKPKAVPYTVQDRSTGPSDSHLREIFWEKEITEEDLRRILHPEDKKVARKGNGSGATHLAVVGPKGAKRKR
ncbi:MAG: AAA family ATPase, partial [Planctomycetes bacterium]|nr:AAA family ATPase [Planctomycetota bacterium]